MDDTYHMTKATILLADDDAFLREAVAEILTLSGYQVLQSSDGLAAVKVFTEHQKKITLVLLDVIMPGYSGTEVAEHIRQLNPDLPVIFMTGYDGEHLLDGIQHASNTKVLCKPVQYELLIQSIEQIINKDGY